MAKKKYKALVTGVHAATGLGLVRGEVYEIEEKLAGAEIFKLCEDAGAKEVVASEPQSPQADTKAALPTSGAGRAAKKNTGAKKPSPDKED